MGVRRVCMILEGSYPYVRGGVSSWMHEYLCSDLTSEYILWTIYAGEEDAGKYLYDFPPNIKQISETGLSKAIDVKLSKNRHGAEKNRIIADAFRKILLSYQDEWSVLFEYITDEKTLSNFFSSREFLQLTIDLSESREGLGVSDAFYGLRSMLLPVAFLLIQEIPEADIYHSASAGYSGLLGAAASARTGKPFLLTEHGIYPREREEELMLADWIHPALRQIWVRLFYNMSRCAYSRAVLVTSLFEDAARRQMEIGCWQEKIRIIANGIHAERYLKIPKSSNGKQIHIGAFVRFSPIKDIKTLITAFYRLRGRMQNVWLHIMGGIDEEDYYKECCDLISVLEVKGISIEGYVDTAEAMEKMDFTVLSSISEGQPLAILESMAAARPCVATLVGNCRELLEGHNEQERAGICVPPMDVEAFAGAMEVLAKDTGLRQEMGEHGRERVKKNYRHETMMNSYLALYKEAENIWQESDFPCEKQ